MSTRAPLLLVALAAMLAVLYFVLQPDEARLSSGVTPPTDGVEVDGGSDQSRSNLNPAPVEANSAPSLPELPAQRDEVQSGHRVLVLDVDGAPLAGVQVWLREIRPDLVGDLLSYWAANPDKLRPWGLPGQGVMARTNEAGVAQFMLRGAASAGVVLAESMGATSFPAIPEGGTAEPKTLQLVATRSIEVLVRDAADQPVAGKEVKLRLSAAQDLVGLEGEARLMRRSQGGPWLETRVEVMSDAEGRALLPLFLTEDERESLGQIEYWIGEASFEVPAYARVRSEFSLPRAEAVVLRLPAMGSLDLQLVDYPDGVVPQLIDVEGRGDEMAVPIEDSTDGKFRFDGLIVGQKYRVYFYAVHIDAGLDGDRSFSTTHLTEKMIEGPEAHGEVTERSLRYERTPGFYGRFILPEHRRQAVQFSMARDFEARGIADRLSECVERIGLSVFPDGSFYVSPTSGYSLDAKRSLTDFHTLAFEWWTHGVTHNNPGNAAQRRTLFASVPIEQVSDDQVIELGDVYLQEDPYLLHVTVRDAHGEPVPAASVSLAAITEGSIDGQPSQRSMVSLWADDRGEVWVQDLSWYTEFGLAPPDSRYAHFGKIKEIVVTASHGNFAPTQARIQLDRRELELVLTGAGSAEGSFIPCEGLNMVWIAWLPVGAPLTHDHAGAVGRWGTVDANSLSKGKLTEFSCASIPEGTWDVAFSVGGNLSHEVLRVSSVEIKGGEVCRDPRLQNIDIGQLVAIYRAEFRTAQGAPVTPPGLRGRLEMRLGPNHYASHQLRWSNGGLGFAEPQGVPLDGYITDDNWLSIDLSTLRAGTNVVTVYPRREQIVQATIATPLDEGVEWTVYLAGKIPPLDFPSVQLDRNGTGSVTLSAAARYELTWQARVQGELVTSESTTRDFTLAELTGDAALRFVPPASFLEAIRERSGG